MNNGIIGQSNQCVKEKNWIGE